MIYFISFNYTCRGGVGRGYVHMRRRHPVPWSWESVSHLKEVMGDKARPSASALACNRDSQPRWKCFSQPVARDCCAVPSSTCAAAI